MKKIRLAVVIALGILLLTPFYTLAVSGPESITLANVKIFQNIFEEGDWLVVARYDLDYANVPDEPASDIYAFSVCDGDTAVATRNLNEYGHNLISIWFSASDVASKSLVWGYDYTAKIHSKPPYSLASASRSMGGHYLAFAATQSRDYLEVWILTQIKIIEEAEGVTLTTSTGAALNVAGTTLVSDAIPGVTSILNIFLYGEESVTIVYDEHTRALQEALSGFIDITLAESTTNWSGTSLNTTWDRVEGRYAVKDIVASPTIANVYSTIYNPSGTWDLTDGKEVVFFIKDSRYSENFTAARIYLYDSSGKYVYWGMPFNSNVWTCIGTDNMTGEGGSGGFDSSITDNITWSFTAADTIGFYNIIDSVKVSLISPPGLGRSTWEAFEGFADWLGVSATVVASAFFLITYLVTASVIYFVMGSGIAALAVAAPVGMLALYPFGVVPFAGVFVAVIVLVVLLGYLIYLRGM